MAQEISSEFIQECIKQHNNYREWHDSPPLVEDSKLNEFAQEWAEKLAEKDVMEHREDNKYGENLYQSYNSDPNWELKPIDVVKAWYEEISMYKFDEADLSQLPKNANDVGHFTQLVWKESKKVGVGMATSGTGQVYVVCNYEPPGNITGEFTKNVLPAKKSTKIVKKQARAR